MYDPDLQRQARRALHYLRSVLRETAELAHGGSLWSPSEATVRVDVSVMALTILDTYLTNKRSMSDRSTLRDVMRSLLSLQQIDAPVQLSDGGRSRLILALPVEDGQDPIALSSDGSVTGQRWRTLETTWTA